MEIAPYLNMDFPTDLRAVLNTLQNGQPEKGYTYEHAAHAYSYQARIAKLTRAGVPDLRYFSDYNISTAHIIPSDNDGLVLVMSEISRREYHFKPELVLAGLWSQGIRASNVPVAINLDTRHQFISIPHFERTNHPSYQTIELLMSYFSACHLAKRLEPALGFDFWKDKNPGLEIVTPEGIFPVELVEPQ